MVMANHWSDGFDHLQWLCLILRKVFFAGTGPSPGILFVWVLGHMALQGQRQLGGWLGVGAVGHVDQLTCSKVEFRTSLSYLSDTVLPGTVGGHFSTIPKGTQDGNNILGWMLVLSWETIGTANMVLVYPGIRKHLFYVAGDCLSWSLIISQYLAQSINHH